MVSGGDQDRGVATALTGADNRARGLRQEVGGPFYRDALHGVERQLGGLSARARRWAPQQWSVAREHAAGEALWSGWSRAVSVWGLSRSKQFCPGLVV
jgi:hypothetical protein